MKPQVTHFSRIEVNWNTAMTMMKSVKHTAMFEMAQPIEKLFPLFSPEGETLWVPGWDYENVMGTTELSENYVFLTKSHDHGSTEAIWMVKSYEPESSRVQFYKIEPGDKVGIITVQCSEPAPGRTEVRITYEYIAIAEKGNRFVESFDEGTYADFIGEWETLLLKYFA